MPVPAAADGVLFPLEGDTASQGEDADLSDVEPARVSIAQPVGQVIVSTFQDAQGAARYGARQGDESSGLVRFTSSRPRPGNPASVTVLGGTVPAGLPLARGAITSGYGARRNPVTGEAQRHAGIDLAAPTGSPVMSTGGGTVSFAGYAGNYGLLVVVDHGNGVHTRYAHLSQLGVRPGQTISTGEVVGLVGATGRTTGPHVHYELRVNGQAIDPR